MAQQKAKDEIERALNNVDTSCQTKYPGMTYEQGVEEALTWCLGELEDGEFEYSSR
jgi:hypothetical protein